jgi:hypothetical protein
MEDWELFGHILVSHLGLSQPGGPGPRISSPQEQGGPVIPPCIGFSLRHHLRFEGLRWRYSNAPPHRPYSPYVDTGKAKLTGFITPGQIKKKPLLALSLRVVVV